MTLALYRALIRLLPRSVRAQHGEEMLRALADQIAESRNPRRDQWRALRRFPLVLALEWRDVFRASVDASQPAQPAGNMDALSRILRQGARSLMRSPVFSLSVILLLGVGVGSVSAIFAVVDHVLLRQMPYASAERLFVIENGSHSIPSFHDFQAIQSADAWAAATAGEANLTDQGDPLRVRKAVVTDGFFGMFGARARLGRLFQPSDFEAAHTAALSYGTWVRVFGGDSTVIGRTIHVDNVALRVVGVLDGNFAVPEALVDVATDVWTPLDPAAAYMTQRDHWMFSVAGRLREGASLDQAQQEISRIATDRARTWPKLYAEDGVSSDLPVRSLQQSTTGSVERGLKVLLGAVTLLLLVACANVTQLFLARGLTRTREMAVRRALGAGTWSLVMQLFAESLLLGIAGAVVGAVLAFGGVRAFLALMPDGLPRVSTIAIDTRVLLFAAAVGIATAAVFGLIPALRFTRRRFADPMRDSSRSVTGGRRTHMLRHAIVVVEVAVSLVLVAQAGWLMRSFIRLNNQELGFKTTGVVTMPMTVTGIDSASAWNARMEAMRASLASTRGVRDVAFGLTMPLEWVGGGRCCWGTRLTFTGKERLERGSAIHPVTENYFEVLGIRIIAGAAWTRADAIADPAPAVINAALASAMFGTAEAALGATLKVNTQAFVVRGVAANNRHYGADQPYGTALYIPAISIPYSPGRVHMAVLTDRTDETLQADLRAAIWRTEPNLPVPVIRSIGDWSRRAAAQRRFDSYLFGTFSAIALLLVAGGLAGTLFYMVNLQRRSLGIRLALGATPHGLERGVITSGVGMAAIGVALGTVGAWYAGKLIESRLYGVQARDVRTLGLAVAVLMVIALLSSWVPARRAAGTNPIESLRAD